MALFSAVNTTLPGASRRFSKEGCASTLCPYGDAWGFGGTKTEVAPLSTLDTNDSMDARWSASGRMRRLRCSEPADIVVVVVAECMVEDCLRWPARELRPWC